MPIQRNFTLVSFALLLALAFGARFWQLGEESLWSDEYYTLLSAGRPTAAAVTAWVRDRDPHPAHYFLALHYWIEAFGRGPVGLRSLSALMGGGAVALVYLLGRLLKPSDPRLAVGAALGCAIHPMLIWYSQEARPYAALVFWETLAATLAAAHLRARALPEDSPWRRWSAPAALGAAAAAGESAWFHYYGAFVVMATGIVLLGAAWSARGRGRAAPIAALALLACAAAPAGFRALANWGTGKGIDWLPPSMEAMDLVYIAEAQLIGPLARLLPAWPTYGLVAAGAIWALCGLCGLGTRIARREPSMEPLWPKLVPVVYLAFAFVAPIAISFAVRPIIFHGQRYLVIASPFIVLSFVWTFLGSRGAWRVAGGCAALALLSAQAGYLYYYYGYRQKPTWDAVAKLLTEDSTRAPGEPIIVLPERTGGLLAYYAPQLAPCLAPIHPGFPPPGGAYIVATADVRPQMKGAVDFTRAVMRCWTTHAPGNDLWIYRFPPAALSPGAGQARLPVDSGTKAPQRAATRDIDREDPQHAHQP